MEHTARHHAADFEQDARVGGAEVGVAAADDEQAAGHRVPSYIDIARVRRGGIQTRSGRGIGPADEVSRRIGIDGVATAKVAHGDCGSGERSSDRQIPGECSCRLEDGTSIHDEGAGGCKQAVGFDDGAGDRLGDLERAGHRVAGGVDVAVVEGSAEGAG